VLPSVCHATEQYERQVEADHGSLKSPLRPMRGLKRMRSTRVISTGHVFIKDLPRGHYELALNFDPNDRLAASFTELALGI
jgi:IS6 family transposase